MCAGSDGRSIISVQESTPQYDEDAIAMMMGSDEEDDDFVLMWRVHAEYISLDYN